MKPNILLAFLVGQILALSCNINEFESNQDEFTDKPITISGSLNNATKANEKGFEDNDDIGVYIVDYQNGQPGELQNTGNRADNLRFTYNLGANKWIPAYEVYWKDKYTNVDIYGYYPYGAPADVHKYIFEVDKDQRTKTEYGELGGYEASDFLWGKVLNNSPTSKTIRLGLRHMMSCVRITLLEGMGFEKGEWDATQKEVLILNTVRQAEIDLTTGKVTPNSSAEGTGIIPNQTGNEYRGIVVPQTIKSGSNVVSVTVGGESYFLKKTQDITFIPSKLHNFTVTVNKKKADGGLDFVLSPISITAWEDDIISHNDVAREYIVIYVESPGTLERCIRNANKDATKIRSLKVNGHINEYDFQFMNRNMTSLSALNLKDAIIEYGEIEGTERRRTIPFEAFRYNKTLTSIVLPDKLSRIEQGAFYCCEKLSGSLIIPEGVTSIGAEAFYGCTNLSGTLYLPTTLKVISGDTDTGPFWRGAFENTGFTCELRIPNNVEYIGTRSFAYCSNLTGEIRLPDKLKLLGTEAFEACIGLRGSLTIPQSITKIYDNSFSNVPLDGTLTLHDGIRDIGEGAFSFTQLKGELRLPKNLETISNKAFYGCLFSGKLDLPDNLLTIGDYAFSINVNLSGILEIPSNVISIGNSAFSNCRNIREIIFPESLETIKSDNPVGGGAFNNCSGVERIICKGIIPANVQDGAFYGIPTDKFTLEVPESAIQLYQTAKGWSNFKKISSYQNFALYPRQIMTLNNSSAHQIKLTADKEWYVERKPDWIELDQSTGTGNADIKLTFTQKPSGTPTRDGEIIFRLKGEDFTTKFTIQQYDYPHADNQFITLQKATKGSGINIVLIGDGFNAKEISEGKLADALTKAYKHFFAIEPYHTYKDYFNVHYAISVSNESGVGNVNTHIDNRFNTVAKDGVTLCEQNNDFEKIINYVCQAPGVTRQDLEKTLVIIVPNTDEYKSISYLWDNGFAISYCPLSSNSANMDFRAIIQHEAGGHAFGKLADESIYHNAFIDACSCGCCHHDGQIMIAKEKGWYDNLSLSGMMSQVPWKHLMSHQNYKAFVDIFEGGFMHSRGVFRSERNSCMNNGIPYFNTISRESIVKRIKSYAGEVYNFEDFVRNDSSSAANPSTKSGNSGTYMFNRTAEKQNQPVFMGTLK